MVGMSIDGQDIASIDTAALGTTMNQTGFFESMKELLSPRGLVTKLQNNKETIMELSLYLGVGFIAGFLLKRYSKFFLFLVIGITGILLLQYNGIISIAVHWHRIQALVGIQPLAVPDGRMASVYWQWVTEHVGIAVSFSVGFVCGLHLG